MSTQWPDEFGTGWMTKNARDLVKIAVYLGGFDPVVLSRKLTSTTRRGMINAATVERLLGEMRA